MIAVIADDYTGAAEIGGIGLRHGMKVVIETVPENGEKADLLIVATDTRSLHKDEAAKQIYDITLKLLKLNPDFIFKKVDSVLRGNIVNEIMAQLDVCGKKRCVLVAANPVFNRVIQNGKYLIDNIPVNQTCFSSDPQYPVKHADVVKILENSENISVINLKYKDQLPEDGIIAGDVTDINDLNKWTEVLDNNTMLAGASGFFNALLEKHTGKKLVKPQTDLKYGQRSFIILGSTYPKDSTFFKDVENKGYYLSNMPKVLYDDQSLNPELIQIWVDDLVTGMKIYGKTIAFVDHKPKGGENISNRIKTIVGKTVKQVLEKTTIDDLLIEGGSTTFKILDDLGIKKLYPVNEIETGVIKMKLKDNWKFNITTKPGSYFWPKDVWVPGDIKKFNNIAYD